MGKLRKLQTIKTKLLSMLIAISIVPVLIMGSASYFIAQDIIEDKLQVTSSQTTHEITRGIDNYFSAMSNILSLLANDINIKSANNEQYFEFAKGLIANTRATDEAILNVYVGTEKGMFYTDPATQMPDGYNPTERDWYVQAVSNPDRVNITNPYADSATGKMVVSLAHAIENKGKIIGVVAIDIDLTKFSSSLSDITIGDHGYIYITDKDGILIAHPDQKLIGTDTVTKLSFWNEAMKSDTGFYSYEYEKEKKFASQDTNELTGWKVIASLNYDELRGDTWVMAKFLIFMELVTLFAAVFIALLFSNAISKNIKVLLVAFNKMAQGDLTTSLNIKSKDEFNTIGIRFNEMAQNISKLIRDVNNASATVLDTSVILANTAEETNASLSEVARAVDEVAKGAMEQAQNASEGAYSITELAEKLTTINKSTDVMNQLTQNANDLTIQGLSHMEGLMTKSDQTMQSAGKVATLVNETNESVKKIEDISKAIDAITEQTNLLSLNASIEAARAGEEGKGFAVVANEIRKLADQSKASTDKIQNITKEISIKTSASVEAMEEAFHVVTAQMAVVTQTQLLFNNIMTAINKLLEMNTEIKNNSNEISRNKNEVVAQIENISAISEESASASEEVTASTEQISVTMDEISRQANDLQNLSEQLQVKINSFKF